MRLIGHGGIQGGSSAYDVLRGATSRRQRTSTYAARSFSYARIYLDRCVFIFYLAIIILLSHLFIILCSNIWMFSLKYLCFLSKNARAANCTVILIGTKQKSCIKCKHYVWIFVILAKILQFIRHVLTKIYRANIHHIYEYLCAYLSAPK